VSELLFERLTLQEVAMRLVVPLLVTLFFIQGFRTYVINLYVAVWNIIWSDAPLTPLLTLLVFAAPLLGVAAERRITPRRIVAFSAILTAVFELPVSLGLPYEFELLMSSLVIAFYSLFLPFYLSSEIRGGTVLRREGEVTLFAVSFFFALGYDVLVRAFGVTYDVSRTMVYLPVQLALTIIVIILVTRGWLGEPEQTAPAVGAEELEAASRMSGVLIPAGIGALLFLELVLLANPHNVLRWAQPSYTLWELALLTPLLILVITVAAFALAYPQLRSALPLGEWRFFLAGNIIIFASVACLFFLGTWLAVVLVLIAQFFIVLDLYATVHYVVHSRFRWRSTTVLAVSFFLGLLILLVWDFMFAFTFTHAYLGALGDIFEGQAPTLALVATAILCITSTIAAIKIEGRR